MAEPLRRTFTAELEQLRLQAELVALRVEENLERMQAVLAGAPSETAQAAFEADDGIDAMVVSLTRRCYDLLGREAPVASDLRLVVSIDKILGELERIGDLALRVIKLRPELDRLEALPALPGMVRDLADRVVDCYRLGIRAWAASDDGLLGEVAARKDGIVTAENAVLAAATSLGGPDAAPTVLVAAIAARSLERIGDHVLVIGARLRYLLTGDPQHLVGEVR